jgi:polyphosphate:AMP phosphotransferase
MMFERYDLNKTTDDKTYGKSIAPLQLQLGVLQRSLRDQRVPLIIVVEGWNASGITMVINELIQFLDPRGFSLYSVGSPTDEEQARPLLWRFWVKTPAKGRIAIFARSWYSRSLAEQVSGIDTKRSIKDAIATINNFERQLADDGAIILKFFLHISKEEQRKRLNERENDPLISWMITKGDWDFHNQYDNYLPIIEQCIEGTDHPHAPWTVVEATDKNHSILKVYSTVIKALEKRVSSLDSKGKNQKKNDIVKPKRNDVKRKSSPQVSITKTEYEKKLLEYQDRIRSIHYILFKRKIPLVIVYEGWDAAGKGGNIIRLVRRINPRGYDVVPIGRPDTTELDHHYLWRFYTRFPKAGHVTIFDRSWYGRLLVERVEGLCEEYEWKRAYSEINEMEEAYVGSGGGLIKFWLEISKDEQLKRFKNRQADPLKQWKINDDDWRNREKWDQYEAAVEEMLARTSTPAAPWTVIESDDKWFARLKTLKTVIDYSEELFR